MGNTSRSGNTDQEHQKESSELIARQPKQRDAATENQPVTRTSPFTNVHVRSRSNACAMNPQFERRRIHSRSTIALKSLRIALRITTLVEQSAAGTRRISFSLATTGLSDPLEPDLTPICINAPRTEHPSVAVASLTPNTF